MIVHSVERRGKQVGWPRVLFRFYLAFWVGILLWFILRDVVPFETSGFRSSFCLLGMMSALGCLLMHFFWELRLKIG